MSGGGSSGSTTATGTQNSAPWSVQQPYLASQFGQAANLYNQGALAPYAPLTSNQTSALDSLYGASTASPYTNQALSGLSGIANGTGILGNITGGTGVSTSGALNPEIQGLLQQSGNAQSSVAPYASLAGQIGSQSIGAVSPMVGTLSTQGGTALGQGVSGLTGIANGSASTPGANTLSMLASGNLNNPLLGAMFSQAADQVQGQMTGAANAAGMYGSGDADYGQTTALDNLATQLYGGEYDATQNRALSAAQSQSTNALTADNLLASTGLTGLTNAGNLTQNAYTEATNAELGAGQLTNSANQTAINLLGTAGNLAATQGNLDLTNQAQQLSAEQQIIGATEALPTTEQGLLQNLSAGYNAATPFQTQFQDELSQPQNALQAYQGLISGNYGTTASGSQTNPYFTNPLGSALSGATGLVGLGSNAANLYSKLFGSGSNPNGSGGDTGSGGGLFSLGGSGTNGGSGDTGGFGPSDSGLDSDSSGGGLTNGGGSLELGSYFSSTPSYSSDSGTSSLTTGGGWSGAAGGAVSGAALGSTILPGWGTLIGGAVGAIAGGLGG